MSRRQRPPRRPKGQRPRFGKTPAERRRDRRALVMGVFFCACLVALLWRIWYFQDVWGDEYTRLAVQQESIRHISRAERSITPSRGIIADRNMQPIASSQQVFTVFLDVYELHNRCSRLSTLERNLRDEALTAITSTFNVSRFTLDALFETDINGDLLNPIRHFILAHHVTPEIAIPLIEAFPDIHADEESLRWYHDPFFAPQVIGFIRGDAIWGLESQYNRQLEGELGRTFWVSGEVEEIPVRHGHTLVTTLDGDIQRLAQQFADDAFIDIPSNFVGIIVMNPHTGEILAMAQAPTFSAAEPFNPNLITDQELFDDWGDLSNDQRINEMMRLWRNYHTTRSSEPGSIFKPFVIAAAIEEGIIDRHTTFFCEGRRQIYDQTIECWNIWGHQGLTLTEALAVSCNLAMVDINQALRRANFYRYRGYFGFGERTGIDLPGEEAVNHPAVMYTYHRLNAVEMATSSMGQGFNATAIQSITGYAALINGGYVLQPFLVSQVIDNHGNIVQENQRTVVRRAISQQTSDFIRREMENVVTYTSGTGRSAAIPGHAIAGKTGTAQQGERGIDAPVSLTFLTYTPIENPEYLVLITIDNVHERGVHVTSGGFVGPIMRDFLEALIRLRNLPPSEGPYAIEDWHIMMGTPEMPDFRGQRLADVVRNINNVENGGYHVIGSGTIIRYTTPAPGQPMPATSPIFFIMCEDSIIEELMVQIPNVEGLTLEQAEFILREAGLPPVRAVNANARANAEGHFFPRTAGAAPIDETGYGLEPSPPAPYIVQRQFPAADSIVELGTQVQLRVR